MGIRTAEEAATDVHAVGPNGDVVRIHRKGHCVENTRWGRAGTVGRAFAEAGIHDMVLGDVIEDAVIVLAIGAILSRDVFFAAPVAAVSIEEGVVARVRSDDLLRDGPNAVFVRVGHGVVSGRPEVVATSEEHPLLGDAFVGHVDVERHIYIGHLTLRARTVIVEVDVVQIHIPTRGIGRTITVELAVELHLKHVVPRHAGKG